MGTSFNSDLHSSIDEHPIDNLKAHFRSIKQTDLDLTKVEKNICKVPFLNKNLNTKRACNNQLKLN